MRINFSLQTWISENFGGLINSKVMELESTPEVCLNICLYIQVGIAWSFRRLDSTCSASFIFYLTEPLTNAHFV